GEWVIGVAPHRYRPSIFDRHQHRTGVWAVMRTCRANHFPSLRSARHSPLPACLCHPFEPALKKYFTLRPAGQGVVERAGLLSKLQSAGDIVAACSGLDWRTTDDRPITARSPSQNGYIERLIGSIRRECFEHVIMLGEGRLRRILKLYADYHNGVRTQL